MNATKASAEPFSVLVIDDEQENNDAMQRAFRRRVDLKVQCVTSSDEGLRLVQREAFHLLLVDYSIGAKNGVDFAEQARAVAPHAIVIMVTAYPELKHVVDAHAKGLLDGILAKPWTPDELNATISHATSMLQLREVQANLRTKKPK